MKMPGLAILAALLAASRGAANVGTKRERLDATWFLNGQLLLTGENGYLATSSNGIQRTQRLRSIRRHPVMQAGIYHPQYGYIIGGEQCALMYSKALSTWTYGHIGTAACMGELNGMAMPPNGKVLATASAGTGIKLRRLDPATVPAR